MMRLTTLRDHMPDDGDQENITNGSYAGPTAIKQSSPLDRVMGRRRSDDHHRWIIHWADCDRALITARSYAGHEDLAIITAR